MTARLEELLAAATAWDDSSSYFEQRRVIEAQRELRKLAPDAVRLLIDMGDELRKHNWRPDKMSENIDTLLARLDRLGNTT